LADELDELAKAAILEWLSIQYIKKPNYSHLAPEFHVALKRELEKYGYDTMEKTIGLVKIMAESGQLHERNNAYRISNKGREDLETIYNDDWVASKRKEYANKKKIAEEEKRDQFDLDERRHQEIVDAAREGNKIQKYSVWGAIAIGSLALIIAIFKP